MTAARPDRVYLGLGVAQGLLWAAWWVGAIGLWTVDLALSPIQLVLLGVAIEGAVMVSESPTGAVADTFSRKWSIVLSWALVGVASIASALGSDLGPLLLWQALWGFGYTFQTGADTAWVTDEIGREDDRLIMFHAVASTIGSIVGIAGAVGSLMWLGVSVRGVMVAAGIGSLVVAVLTAVAMAETNFTPVDRGERSSARTVVDTWKQGLGVVRRSRVLRMILVMVVIVAMADELIDRLDVLRMIELGMPSADGVQASSWAGGLWMAMVVVRLPIIWWAAHKTEPASPNVAASAAAPSAGAPSVAGPSVGAPSVAAPSVGAPGAGARGVGERAKRVERRSVDMVATLFVVSTLGVMTMVGGWFWFAVAGWAARDVARELAEPLVTAWINRHAESEVRATVISFRSQTMALGQIVGGLGLGLLVELTTIRTGFVAAALCLAVAAAIVATLRG